MHLNVAGSSVDAGMYHRAMLHYSRGLAVEEYAADTICRLVHLSQRICDWRAMEGVWPIARNVIPMEERLMGNQHPATRSRLSPMHALTLPLTAWDLVWLAVEHATALDGQRSASSRGLYRTERVSASFQPPGRLTTVEKTTDAMAQQSGPHRQQLRVGYVSADFKQHPVSSLLAPTLLACRRSCNHASPCVE